MYITFGISYSTIDPFRSVFLDITHLLVIQRRLLVNTHLARGASRLLHRRRANLLTLGLSAG